MADASAPGPEGTDPVPVAVDPTRPLKVALRGLTAVVAPTSLVTSLLFYFGWVRTSVQADDLGLHDSLLGFSTRDYVLRSIDPMLWPLTVGVVAALAAVALHAWLLAWAADESALVRRRGMRRLAVVGGIVGATGLVVGSVGSRARDPSDLVFVASPILVTAGVVLAGYSLYVRGRYLGPRRRPKPNPELGRLRLMASSLMVVLLLLSMFWSVQRYAYVKGGHLAVELIQGLDYRPDVTIYSAKRLHLQPPVKEVDLGDDGAAYRFRYTDLKLLFHANGRYFLRPSDATTAVNIVIPDSGDQRFEFYGGRA